jgi:hypothetical protein
MSGSARSTSSRARLHADQPGRAEHLPLDAAVIDPRTELASVLVRLKYGGDRVLGDRATHLLVHWVRHQKAYTNWSVKPRSSVLDRFAQQCLGRMALPCLPGLRRPRAPRRRSRRDHRAQDPLHALQQLGPRDGEESAPHLPRLRRQRMENAPACTPSKTRECTSCLGTGLRRPSDAERVRVLGIEHKTYLRHWLKRFAWLAAGLDRLDRLQKYCLQSQLRAGINRA